MFVLILFSNIFISLFSFIKNYKGFATVVLIIFLTIIAGTRLNIAPDYELYYNLFHDSVMYKNLFFSYYSGIEISTYLIPNFNALFFSENYINISFLTFAFIGVLTKMKVIYQSNTFFLSFLLYFTGLFFIQEMITVRAGIASGIFLLSINDLKDRNDKNFFVKMVFCFLFHYSSVIFLLTWLILKLKFAIKFYFLALGLSFVIIILNWNILTILMLDRIFPKVQIYLTILEIEGGDQLNIFNFRIIFSILMLIVFTVFRVRFREDDLFQVLLKIHLISLILFFVLSTTAITFSLRVFELLSIIQILLFPYIVKIFPNRFRIIGYFIIVLYCIVQVYYILGPAQLFKNYNSWLF